jgi:N-acetylglucosamine kinase-like BadF-type ATPase
VSEARAAVLAVDGGNSKTDLALVARNGALLALVKGPTMSHQQVPIATAVKRLRGLLADARHRGSVRGAIAVGSFCLAGADFPPDVRLLRRALGEAQVAGRIEVRNDAFAALRAGAPSGWGIVVICGEGINAAGTGPDGREERLAGVGDLSGDWGGGYGIGKEALAAAVRARDGRGRPTTLTTLVPRALGVRRPIDVTRAMYEGRMVQRRLSELAPVVFRAAGDGDAVARALVDRLADELAVMAVAIARRLRVARREVDVVLTGGVFRTSAPGFHARLRERLEAGLPRARLHRLTSRPVMGAALLGLDALGMPRGGTVERRLRDAF